MKIVVLDGYTENPGDLSWEALEALGELKVYDRVSYVESPVIAETIGDADVAITNKTPISKATIDACPNLKAIAVLATGYNVVDYAYAGEKGIPVMNVPTYGTQIVGQYAVGLLLEICSHYQHHSDTVKAGKWENNVDWCYWDFPMIELYGKTAGIIGLGRIGRTTAGILNALGNLSNDDPSKGLFILYQLLALLQRALNEMQQSMQVMRQAETNVAIANIQAEADTISSSAQWSLRLGIASGLVQMGASAFSIYGGIRGVSQTMKAKSTGEQLKTAQAELATRLMRMQSRRSNWK